MAMSLLERYDEMQRRPLGTNTALSNGSQRGVGGTSGSMFRRQEQGYARALRLLDRQARRGDVDAALKVVDVRNSAMGQGVMPGGIQNVEDKNQRMLGRISAMDAASAANRAKEGVGVQIAQEAARPVAPEEPDTVNPNATAGAGRGKPLSFTDEEKKKREQRFGRRGGIASRWDSRKPPATRLEELPARSGTAQRGTTLDDMEVSELTANNPMRYSTL